MNKHSDDSDSCFEPAVDWQITPANGTGYRIVFTCIRNFVE